MERKTEIADKLREIAGVFCNENYKEDCTNNFLGDSSSAVLFLLHYARMFHDEKAMLRAVSLFEKVAAAYNGGYAYPPSLAKFQVMVSYIMRQGVWDMEDYSVEEKELLQSYLRKTAATFYQQKNYDILHGGLGNGLYLLLSGDKQGVSEMIDGIESLAESDANGLKWFSLTDYEEKRWTYNLGFAHGMPSLVAMLSKVYAAGLEQEKCRKLAEGAVKYILAQKLPKGNYVSVFGNYALESMEQPHSSRLAWCYGDLGIAVALWQASQAFGRKDWEEEAKTILLHASHRRDLKENYVMDACLCHGTSGIAHIFNKMWHYTGMPDCKEAADYWVEQTLKMARFEDGYAGYKSWKNDEEGYTAEYGMLEGVAGIGLALLSYVSDEELKWDECLLLS